MSRTGATAAAAVALALAGLAAPGAGAQDFALTHLSDGTPASDPSLEAFFHATARDGGRAFFATAEPLLPSDSDGAIDVYARDRDGTLRHVSDTPLRPDAEVEVFFGGASRDGGRAFFATAERMAGTDGDLALDVYAWSLAGLRHVSDAPGRRDAASPASFVGASARGTHVFFQTAERLGGTDTDRVADVYAGRPDGSIEHVSDDPGGRDRPAPASFAHASADGRRVVFATGERLAEGDDDDALDLYQRTSGGLRHLTDGSGRADAASEAVFSGASDDGEHVFFSTTERLAPSDSDGTRDVYARSVDGRSQHVSDGDLGVDAHIDAIFGGVSADGLRATFSTLEPLGGGDADEALDVYERTATGAIALLSGSGDSPGPPRDARFAGASIDGLRVFLETTEPLLGEDTDESADVYEATGSGSLRLVSDFTPGSDAESAVRFGGSSTDGARLLLATTQKLTDSDSDAVGDVYERTDKGFRHLTDNRTGTDAATTPELRGASADAVTIFFHTAERLLESDDDRVRDVYSARIDDPPSALDPVPPVVSNGRVEPARSRAAGRLRFTLSEPARVTVTVRDAAGRAVGRLKLRGEAGPNRLRLTGERPFAPGRYEVTVGARDLADNAADPERVTFEVLARR